MENLTKEEFVHLQVLVAAKREEYEKKLRTVQHWIQDMEQNQKEPEMQPMEANLMEEMKKSIAAFNSEVQRWETIDKKLSDK
jgi:hypothetical protein